MADETTESDLEKYSRSSHESDLNHFPLDLVDDKSRSQENMSSDNEKVDGPLTHNGSNSPTVDTRSLSVKQIDKQQDLPPLSSNIKDTSDCAEFGISQDDCTVRSKRGQHSKCSPCCASCKTKCLLWCSPCRTKQNPLPENPSRQQKLKYSFMCPPHGKVAQALTSLLALICFYGALWGITGDQALPGGNFFALIVLFICCILGGVLVEKIRLPPLLGMLLVGVLLSNVPKIDIAKNIDENYSSALRSIALVVILTRAGLGLDPKALKKLSFGVVRLAFTPCLVEAVTAAVTSHFILGFPWAWGFMLGFVLAAVSPAVVVPSMLGLTEKGYGLDKGIPTLVIAASSIDDVLAITGFGIVLDMAFSKGNLVITIIKGPLEAILGVVYGIVFGVILWYLPHLKHTSKTAFRFLVLFSAGLVAQFCSRRADISGAGPLGSLTLAFVVALRWRNEVSPGHNMPMEKLFSGLWVVFQPLLFGLIGAEINISQINPKTIGLGIAVLCIGLFLRLLASFFVVVRLGLNLKERFFVALAWLPKATVQAAIGSIALDTARAKPNPVPGDIVLGKQILTIAVLVILITAPIGAAAISLAGPRLLHKSTLPTDHPPAETSDMYHNKDDLQNTSDLNDVEVVYVL